MRGIGSHIAGVRFHFWPQGPIRRSEGDLWGTWTSLRAAGTATIIMVRKPLECIPVPAVFPPESLHLACKSMNPMALLRRDLLDHCTSRYHGAPRLSCLTGHPQYTRASACRTDWIGVGVWVWHICVCTLGCPGGRSVQPECCGGIPKR